jgi:hypothetical protein
MKTFFHSIVLPAAVICVGFFFSHCTKQIDKPLADEKETSAFSASLPCKPVLLGYMIEGCCWGIEMQKWYRNDGKVAYLKAVMGIFPGGILPWGEISYHNNNQVYVKNTLYNDTLIRITLDAQQRPSASYFLYPRAEIPYRDTSYYYFTDNRLDSILSLFGPFFDVSRITFRKFTFTYDAYGNVVQIRDYNVSYNAEGIWKLTYDYTKPVAGMLPSYMLDRPYRLLEYLDLLHFPVRHQLVSVSQSLFGLTFSSNYFGHQLLGNGLVQSYKETTIPNSFTTRTYYVDWDCAETPTSN